MEGEGFRALIVGERPTITVPVGDLAPPSLYKVPDLVAISDLNPLRNSALIVEVESRQKKFLEALGKCVLWKTVAKLVYLAYPGGIRPKPEILERYGIGLLAVTEESVEEQIRILPKEGRIPFGVTELHPLDDPRQTELVNQIRRQLGASA